MLDLGVGATEEVLGEAFDAMDTEGEGMLPAEQVELGCRPKDVERNDRSKKERLHAECKEREKEALKVVGEVQRFTAADAKARGTVESRAEEQAEVRRTVQEEATARAEAKAEAKQAKKAAKKAEWEKRVAEKRRRADSVRRGPADLAVEFSTPQLLSEYEA